MEHDERGELIIAKAREFLGHESTEREIDAVFAYDFDPEWNWHINKIRTRALGRDKPYNHDSEDEFEDGVRIEIHSDDLWDAEIYTPPIVIGNGKSNIDEARDEFKVLKPRRKDSPRYKREIVHENGKYYERFELDAGVELNRLEVDDKRLEELFRRLIHGDEQARAEYDRLYNETKEYEAAVVEFNNALRRLATLYNLDAKIVRRAVLWGRTPDIPIEGEYALSEWQRGKVKHIMIMNWDMGEWVTTEISEEINKDGHLITHAVETLVKPPPPKRKRPMAKTTRIRTWTIYRLTKRGGGRLILDEAIQRWNDKFDLDGIDPDKRNNYTHQLNALLGEKKRKEYENWLEAMDFSDDNLGES
ncbi:MAG: hypothetical protein BroJett039_04580 [Chloroflexota bacterium]|nr:MAG: hypothetical protein BroJett039_04580 [Chloroflexota bacterium]